jgi:hypothetical protein
MSASDVAALLDAAGIRPELAATFVAHALLVARVLYPAAKALPIARQWRSPAVLGVTAIVGAAVAYVDGVPLTWGISTTLAAAAAAMAAHDAAHSRAKTGGADDSD